MINNNAHLLYSTTWDIGPRYVFVRVIGAGAYGSVCEAIDNNENKRVAIKKFTNILSDAVLCQRVLREIEILYALNHPSIVKPLDLIIRPGSIDIYLVMELAQSDLRKLLRSPIYLEKKQVKVLMYRMLIALNYLHSGGIVHRDLKPGNILINGDCTLKICDFSLSRSLIGLKSGAFDCDKAIRRNPLLNFSNSSSSNEFDEGVEANRAYNFQINLSKSDRIENSKDKEITEKEIKKTQKEEGVLAKKMEERKILLTKCKETVINFKRELTGYVGTRWYRSPEIILLEKVYSSSVDIWAAGCIFAELLKAIKENVADYRNRKTLFPGDSCFPLSPSSNPTIDVAGFSISSRDQLKVIIDFKGTPTESDVSFLNDEKANAYIKAFPESKGTKLSKVFPNEDKLAISLLEKMLAFNPYFRITAKEALRHKYFADIRDKELEYEFPSEVTILADKFSSDSSVEYITNAVLTKIITPK